jgi:predicted Zn-dependent protease
MSVPGMTGVPRAGSDSTAATASQSEDPAKPAAPSTDGASQPASRSKTTAASTGGDDPLKDKYCDSFAESYEVATSVVKAVRAVAPAASMQIVTGGKVDVETTMRDVSKKYVWIPIQVEKAVGKQMYDRKMANAELLARNAENKDTYAKAEAAFEAAKRDYKTPFELKLFIVKAETLNAEALPAGYVMLDSEAAANLDPDTLRFILGHEIAHSAKRHNSKQLQQRMIDIGVAQQMFEKLMKGGNPNDFVLLFGDQNVIKKFGGNFAAYQRDQEMQADACAIHEMVRAHVDPQQAFAKYLNVRPSTEIKTAAGGTEQMITAWVGDFSIHPTDATRKAFFSEATRHHQQALAAK